MSDGSADARTVESLVPARRDRATCGRWHWLVIVAFGVTWSLDGLEVTMAGDIAAVLTLELHPRHEVPTAFFMLGTALERRGRELRRHFGGDPLFEPASHTCSHGPLKESHPSTMRTRSTRRTLSAA
ncbi:MAG: hypothetical protein AB1425_08320 [Actinomycetota bacterium]